MGNEDGRNGMVREIKAGDKLGGYRVVRPLGGGMGRVYEVEHEALGVRRALKVFVDVSSHAEERKSLFLAEGRALARVSHPRVVRIHDFVVDEETGTPYFSMDLVLSPDGVPTTLDEACSRGIDEERAAAWFADVCEGLDYIHSQGIVHGDVKLENILIGPDGRAVISDFGISRVFGDEVRRRSDSVPDDVSADLSALHMGTYGYLAPELLRGGPDAAPSPETDAWSLGVMLFRLVTGFWFEDDNREKCLALLDDFDLPWRDVVARLCSRNPSARLDGGRLAPFAERVARRPAPWRRRVRAVAACSALLILAAGAVCAWRMASRRAAAPKPSPANVAPPPAPPQPPATAVRLNLDAPAWREFRSRIDDASRAALLAPFDGMDAEVEGVFRNFIDRQASYYCYDACWPETRIGRMDALVAAQMPNVGAPHHANAPQLLVLAGEVYRQKCLWSLEQGEFPDDVDRLVELTKRVVSDASDKRYGAEWAFEIIEATLPFGRLEGRRIGAKDARFQQTADPWLVKMIQAATTAAEASRAHGSSVSPEDAREHEQKRARATRLFKEALTLHPKRYRAAERLIGLAHEDFDEARRSFERCQEFCFDDLRAWEAYARTQLELKDPRRERLTRLLDHALATGRYDTWVPAFYVIGRWRLLARYDKEGWTLDDRGWAYEDDDVRRKTLETIRRYRDGALLPEAPPPRRLAVTAMFAAAALTCGDEELAAELVRTIPSAMFYPVLGSAMRTTSPLFSRLRALSKTLNQPIKKKEEPIPPRRAGGNGKRNAPLDMKTRNRV